MKLTSYRNTITGRTVFAVHNHGPAAEAEVSRFIVAVTGVKPVMTATKVGALRASAQLTLGSPLSVTVPPEGFLVADSTTRSVFTVWTRLEFLSLHDRVGSS